jgi:hypothetical protein
MPFGHEETAELAIEAASEAKYAWLEAAIEVCYLTKRQGS